MAGGHLAKGLLLSEGYEFALTLLGSNLTRPLWASGSLALDKAFGFEP